jgi:hypothetical protein
MLLEKIGMELHISRLINTMDVSKSSGNAEIGSDIDEGLVDVVHVFRLSVQAGVVDTGVVDAVLLPTSNADLHLEPDTKGCHTFEVFHTSSNVFFFWFL